ncbi:MAG: PspA/IM30 family protein [Armatimonadetes bacterium]|nr:PspA/IM30 family protein [Armatimonadota bacterium]
MFKAIGRLWRYLVAWFTGKVESLEDPDVLLDQARREMQEALAKNRERAIQAITQKNLLQAEVEKLEKVTRDLNAKAELALKQGNRELAMQLVREKKAQEGALVSMKESLQTAAQTVESVKTAIRRQEEETRVKTAQALAMKARWKQAQVQTAINKALEGLSVENIESSWETASQKIQRAEAETKARSEMASNSLTGRLAELQDAQVDVEAEEELKKMEERLGLRTAEAEAVVEQTVSVGGDAPAAAPNIAESDVLKELDELEQKIQSGQSETKEP